MGFGAVSESGGAFKSMNVPDDAVWLAVAGASGFILKALINFFLDDQKLKRKDFDDLRLNLTKLEAKMESFSSQIVALAGLVKDVNELGSKIREIRAEIKSRSLGG